MNAQQPSVKLLHIAIFDNYSQYQISTKFLKIKILKFLKYVCNLYSIFILKISKKLSSHCPFVKNTYNREISICRGLSLFAPEIEGQ